MLLIVQYGFESWFPILREEYAYVIRGFSNVLSLTQIIMATREKITRVCRAQNEELHDVFSTVITTMMKLRRVRWAGHVACKWDSRSVLVERYEGHDSLEQIRLSGSKMLPFFLKKYAGRSWTGLV
jgi:hypothetical protein